MQHSNQRIVRISEVCRGEEAGRTKCKTIRVTVNQSFLFRPSVPGISDVLKSNVRKAVLTFAGLSERLSAEPMVSFGPAIFIAVMKSSRLASASAFRSALKPFLPMASRVPLKSFRRRFTSPRTAMISGFAKRLRHAALYGIASVSRVYSCSSMSMSRFATCSKSIGRSRSKPGAQSPNHHST